jgi:hypothetical protein
MDMGSNPSISGVDIVNHAAREYIERGWRVVPVPRGQKGPDLPDWQKRRITADEVDEWFAGECNVGVLLGEASGGLADVDLDCPEAEHAGSTLLPITMKSGRGGQVTHYWYTSPGSKAD